MTAKVVYFNEFNVRMGRATYFPLVSGILRACAEDHPGLKDAYQFKPFLFHMDTIEAILAKYDEAPDLVAFSVSMWNEQLSLAVAERVKRRWPQALIVFGGPQLPHDPRKYFELHSFIDVGVRAEGETAFVLLLERFLVSRDFKGVPNVSYRDPVDHAIVVNPETPEFARELDEYPSPYLSGLFNYMFEAYPEFEFQAIIETNRGCPFLCTFCYWGRGGTTRKYRYHEMSRVEHELRWCGEHKIRYVFNADSNFGMHKRDREIAEFIVATKQKYGFPEKFRTCWGKNTDENIFEIAAILHANDLEKGITLARQSNSKQVLANIKRGNIKLESYTNLQRRFNDLNLPVYSEMILGLPGETYESWRDGIEELLAAGLKNQLFVYQCEVYPNTDMGDPGYQEKFGIVTKRIELREIHGSVRDEAWIKEYQDIIVETQSMSNRDWRRMTRFATISMLLHSMKFGFFIMGYLTDRFPLRYTALIEYISEHENRAALGSMLASELDFYDAYLDALMSGGGRGAEMPGYGRLYWDVEETGFLRISEDLDLFYQQFAQILTAFLEHHGLAYDWDEIAAVISYQRLRMPEIQSKVPVEHVFAFNVTEYFEGRFGTAPVPLERQQESARIRPRDFGSDAERFARESILWGRKSGTMLVPIERIPAHAEPLAATG
jgi:putative methyltransferase